MTWPAAVMGRPADSCSVAVAVDDGVPCVYTEAACQVHGGYRRCHGCGEPLTERDGREGQRRCYACAPAMKREALWAAILAIAAAVAWGTALALWAFD